ncbi:TetR/AcrR family transcriptional regulator [Flexivirga caeni]|uniref:TetR/AcrR family transcriptional regulator n=1 Tax=Flexivirga caeni TaxID=2294115 RepID=A0A3M9LYI9_9MICO|nr:TetR/AcrR family transcriptional regulator [Flexivirga caeni]RNI18302.1 TetR/AcrR family transcriptional regulator [Flexivirga caeni]
MPSTPRERARVDTMRRILESGNRQLAEQGAAALSLRAVARDLGMVSSAVYRYVPSRDDLLTALITEGYRDVAQVAESAAAGRAAPGRRFVALCEAIYGWAREHPHRYALIFGSPVPGYRAPQDTITDAARTPAAAIQLIETAWAAGELDDPESPPASAGLRRQAKELRTALGTQLPEAVLLRFAAAWTQVFGVISFDLFGQFVGSFEPGDAVCAFTFRTAARTIGFRD